MTTENDEIRAIVAVLRQFSDTEEEMRSLAKIFFTTADDTLKILKANCNGDVQAWVDAAHKLKGSAAMLKAAKICTLSEKAEKMGAAPANDKEELFRDLRTAVEDVRIGVHESFEE